MSRQNMFYSASESGFFSPEIHDVLPEDAVQISCKEYMSLMQGQSQGQVIVSEKNGHPVLEELPTLDLEEVKKAQISKINSEFHRATSHLLSEYPTIEQISWIIQAREILSWNESPENPTPYLDKIALERGISSEEMRNRTKHKINHFMEKSHVLIGRRQGLCDAIKHARTADEVRNILWTD